MRLSCHCTVCDRYHTPESRRAETGLAWYCPSCGCLMAHEAGPGLWGRIVWRIRRRGR